MGSPPVSKKTDRLLYVLALLMIPAGIVARCVVYIQNRNLIIDESNIARNIFERGYFELLKPLSYEQYAPPVFLWMVKLSSVLCGFSEQALKIYPFVCGILSVWLFYKLLRAYLPATAIWLPMLLFAFCGMFIRYATELKQYAPDILVTELLILLALKTDIKDTKPLRFVLIWVLAGSIAIWASMPSVFVLAGVGAYYSALVLKERLHNKTGILAMVYGLWIVQFLFYYIKILAPQANSKYLQNFHRDYFIIPWPTNLPEWKHNWHTIEGLVVQIGGHTGIAVVFVLLTIAFGTLKLLKRDLVKGLLIVVPLFCLLIAAAVNQFSLIPRVSLFGIALMIMLAGYGFYELVRLANKPLKFAAWICGLYVAVCSITSTTQEPFKYEEITQGMKFMKDEHVTGQYLSLYHSAGPAFIYYTRIHPDSANWTTLKHADILPYYTIYDSLAWQMNYVWESKGPFGFIFTNETQQEFDVRMRGLKASLHEVKRLDGKYVKATILVDK